MSLAAAAARRVARWLAPWADFGCDVLLERSLEGPLPAVEPPPGTTLRLAGPADVDALTRLYELDPWLYILWEAPSPETRGRARELYLGRLRRGELCFMAMHGDEIAHVNWSCFTSGEALPGHPIRLRDGEVFTTDAMTLPAYRGKGLHAFVLAAMLAHAQSRGVRRAYTLARLDRRDTFKGLDRVGYRECGRVFYVLPHGRTTACFLWRQGAVEPLFRPASP